MLAVFIFLALEKEIVVTDINVEHMKSVKSPEERKTKEVKLQELRKG